MSETRRLDETATELVRRAQGGDPAAAAELLARCHGTVYRWALVHARDSDDADDIAQEVLVRVAAHLDRFAGRSRFTTWLYQVTRNTALELRRRLARRRRLGRALTGEAAQEAGVATDPVAELHDAQVRDVIVALFRELPRRQREIFHLADLEALSIAEIAERPAMNPVTVRVHLFKARRALRARLRRSSAATPTPSWRPTCARASGARSWRTACSMPNGCWSGLSPRSIPAGLPSMPSPRPDAARCSGSAASGFGGGRSRWPPRRRWRGSCS